MGLNYVKVLMNAALINRIQFWSLTCALVTNNYYTREMGKWAFYAVAKGRKVGIFSTWNECKLQTEGFNGARFKGFNSRDDAQRFVQSKGNVMSNSTKTSNNIDKKDAIPPFQYTQDKKLENIRKRGA